MEALARLARDLHPLARNVYVRGMDTGADGRDLIDVLESLIGEVDVRIAERHGLGTRNLALVKTKLQEARHWAVEEAENQGTHFLVCRAAVNRLAKEIAKHE